MVLLGPHTFAPLTWACKKQGAVSHSTTEAEIIALDASIRCEGIPMIMLWDCIKEVFSGKAARGNLGSQTTMPNVHPVDYVPTNVVELPRKTKLLVMEDNEAVIAITINGRASNLRYLNRTHRVDMDWILERIREDEGIKIRCCKTTEMIADIFTKGSFTKPKWDALLELAQIRPLPEPLNRKQREAEVLEERLRRIPTPMSRRAAWGNLGSNARPTEATVTTVPVAQKEMQPRETMAATTSAEQPPPADEKIDAALIATIEKQATEVAESLFQRLGSAAYSHAIGWLQKFKSQSMPQVQKQLFQPRETLAAIASTPTEQSDL